MKIIFLDIDGVLNSVEYFRRRKTYRPPDWGSWPMWRRDATDSIDPDAAAQLNRIVADTGALVVLSSTWRQDTPLVRMSRIIRYRGFESHLLGATPYIARGNAHVRGDEIGWWLRAAGDAVQSFVILDDDDDMGDLAPQLVLIRNSVGLTKEDADEAIAILGT